MPSTAHCMGGNDEPVALGAGRENADPLTHLEQAVTP